MSAATVLATILLLAGLFFLFVSAVGLIRLPDFYTRTHAAGKTETLGAALVLGGVMVYDGWTGTSLKVLLVLLFVALTSPTGLHALCRAAMHSGLEIWSVRGEEDEA